MLVPEALPDVHFTLDTPRHYASTLRLQIQTKANCAFYTFFAFKFDMPLCLGFLWKHLDPINLETKFNRFGIF